MDGSCTRPGGTSATGAANEKDLVAGELTFKGKPACHKAHRKP